MIRTCMTCTYSINAMCEPNMSKTSLFFNVFFFSAKAPLLQMLFVCLGLGLEAAKRIKIFVYNKLSLFITININIFYALILDYIIFIVYNIHIFAPPCWNAQKALHNLPVFQAVPKSRDCKGQIRGSGPWQPSHSPDRHVLCLLDAARWTYKSSS